MGVVGGYAKKYPTRKAHIRRELVLLLWAKKFAQTPQLWLCRKNWSVPKNTKTYYIVVTYATVHMYLCTGFRQDFLPLVRVDTKWVHKLLMTEWSVSHKTKKKHIVTKDVVGLLLGDAVSTNKHPL